MAHLKMSIVEVKAKEKCLVHALVVAVAKLTNDPDYKAFIQGRKIRPKVDLLLEITGIDLTKGGGIPDLTRLQEYFKEYRIVYGGLYCDDIIFDGRIESENRINLLNDDVNQHYHVIVNLTGALAKTYVCKCCNKGCERDVEHRCQQSCSDCTSIPPCIMSEVRIPCAVCKRTFRSQACYDRHKTNKLRGKTVCAKKRNCAKCGALLTVKKHECFKPYCEYCGENKEVGHLCYMRPLTNILPSSDNVLFVFYDFETTQDLKFTDSATMHVPNLVCLQQFCSLCETKPDINTDCTRCGK